MHRLGKILRERQARRLSYGMETPQSLFRLISSIVTVAKHVYGEACLRC